VSHTPGPWRISSTDDGSVAIVYSSGYEPYKAIRASRAVLREERLDNAFLIAAAPAMLKMLRGIVANKGDDTIGEAAAWLERFYGGKL
jgi:hypothetical protein